MRVNLVIVLIFTLFFAGIVIADNLSSSFPAEIMPVDPAIFSGIEKHYAATGFSARFHQLSTLKAMEITDTASGTILVKRPGMMRWTYEIPEKQVIVSDGQQLWIYRPQDNQVMVGKAPTFFGNGRGAGFLSDLTSLQKEFVISQEKDTPSDDYHLKLSPRKKNQDITAVHLIITKETFNITEIITYNIYDDETRIKLSDIRFQDEIDNSQFQFDIPNGVDVVETDQ